MFSCIIKCNQMRVRMCYLRKFIKLLLVRLICVLKVFMYFYIGLCLSVDMRREDPKPSQDG